jgi:L-threonylcarbamoyladenylate synthase
MTVLKISEDDYDSEVDVAHALLHTGGVMVYPTDTVYGIGGDATNEAVVQRILGIKGIEERKPFSVMMADFGMVEYYCETGVWEDIILKKYLPGPYTFILKKHRDIPASLTEKLGIRMPDSPFCKMLCGEFDKPIITTSANITGGKPPVEFGEVDKRILDSVDVAIDGGRTKFAAPSVIIDLVDRKMIREGKEISLIELPER